MKSYSSKAELQELLAGHIKRAEEIYQGRLIALCLNGHDAHIDELYEALDRYTKLCKAASVLASETIELQELTDG